MGKPSGWEFSLWFSMPGRDELIQSAWKPAQADGRESTLAMAREVASEIFVLPGGFIACETDDGSYYVLPVGQIEWVRVMTRERQE